MEFLDNLGIMKAMVFVFFFRVVILNLPVLRIRQLAEEEGFRISLAFVFLRDRTSFNKLTTFRVLHFNSS